MSFPSTQLILTGLFALGVAVAGAQETMSEKLERENRQLKLQLANLKKSLSASLEREDSKTKGLKEIREYLALRGRDLLRIVIPNCSTPFLIIKLLARVSFNSRIPLPAFFPLSKAICALPLLQILNPVKR
jgi:hypothetical protein